MNISDDENKIPGFEELAPLESFDDNVFISDNPDEQKVCDLVLTLSLIYNDLKNYMWALDQLEKTKPKKRRIARYNGQHSGFNLHMNRLFYAHIRALYDVVNKNQDVIKLPLFEKTIKTLNPDLRELWLALVSIATDGRVNGLDKSIKKVLEQIRHTSISHYNISEIGRGYKEFFSKNPMRAFISHGNKMGKTRFYFADAAIEGYISGILGSEIKNLISNIDPFMDRVVLTLYNIVINFIQNTRNSPFRSEKEVEVE
jgi:hypothetical protein